MQMQHNSVSLNDIANTIGLKINVRKIKVISYDPNKESITISNLELGFESKFIYLSSIVNLHGGTVEEIASRLGEVRAAFARTRPG